MESCHLLIGVLLVLVVQEISFGYEINYKDCSKPNRIRKYSVSAACQQETKETVQPTGYKLLQPKRNVPLKGYKCSIKKSEHIIFCGAFSHQKYLTPPTIDVPQHVSFEECRQLVSSKKFHIPGQGGQTYTVDMDTENIFSIDELGSIHSDQSVWCEGETMRIHGNPVKQVVVLAQWRILLTRQNFIMDNKAVEALDGHIKFPQVCDMNSGGCTTADGTFVWHRPTNPCSLALVRTDGMFRPEGDYLVDDKLKLRLKIESKARSPNHCPHGQVFYTNDPNIMLTHDDGYEGIGASDIDIFLHVNLRAEYLQYKIETERDGLVNILHTEACESKYSKGATGEIFQMDHLFGIRKGDVLYTFDCANKTGVIKPREHCYDSIPIEDGKFVDPITRISSPHATPKECDSYFPLLIETTSQGWVEITNVVKPVKSPETKFVKAVVSEHESDESEGGVGLYSAEEERSWENLVAYGSFKQATLERVSYGVCKADEQGPCQSTGPNRDVFYEELDLDSIRREASQILDWQGRLKDLLKANALWICIIVIVGWTIQITIGFGIIMYTLFSAGIKAGAAATYVLCCMGPYAVQKVRRNAARHRPTAPIGQNHDEEMKFMNGGAV